MRTALTIAGSDSSGGAGIQADLKTFAAHGVYGTSAITAITAQNTLGVSAVVALDPAIVTAQIEAVVSDIPPDAVKIGMLATRAIIDAVADAIDRHRLTPVVLDPVMIAKGGSALLEDDAIDALKRRLVPLATVITPNVLEAERLTGRTIRSRDDQQLAAAALVEAGAQAAIVKGGHMPGSAVDVLFDGHVFIELAADRLDTRHTHGTGCTFASAIAARLALGDDIITAARSAKAYVTEAIRRAPELGRGQGPLLHYGKPGN
jgi:hydroxymethylpyrimidine/phosphomethylpyrimidine kinase